jgi:hypothetical protein
MLDRRWTSGAGPVAVAGESGWCPVVTRRTAPRLPAVRLDDVLHAAGLQAQPPPAVGAIEPGEGVPRGRIRVRPPGPRDRLVHGLSPPGRPPRRGRRSCPRGRRSGGFPRDRGPNCLSMSVPARLVSRPYARTPVRPYARQKAMPVLPWRAGSRDPGRRGTFRPSATRGDRHGELGYLASRPAVLEPRAADDGRTRSYGAGADGVLKISRRLVDLAGGFPDRTRPLTLGSSSAASRRWIPGPGRADRSGAGEGRRLLRSERLGASHRA